MGFTTGFTGGVTLTLSLAYLGVLAHQRHRERQAAVLRQQTLALTALHDPLPPALPPLTRAERAAAGRHHLVDAAKDRWNAELAHAARWAQTKDWGEAREQLEDAVAGLWARAFGSGSRSGGAGDSKTVAEEAGGKVASAVKTAKSQARGAAAATAEKAEKKAEESSGGVFSAIGRGFSRGKEAIANLGRAKADAEQKAEDKLSGLSAEEKVLQQRYQKPRADDRSAEEILTERYLPTNQKDNAKLKTL